MTSLLKDVELEPLFKLIIDCDARMDWDKIVKKFEVYEKLDDISDVIYCVIKTPPTFSNRDYVQYRHFMHNKRNKEMIEKYNLFTREHEYYVLYLKSVEIPELPPVKGLVRADTLITGYLIEQIGRDVMFTMVLQTDVKGYIPKSIFNRVSTRVPGMWLKNLMTGYAEKKKNEEKQGEKFD